MTTSRLFLLPIKWIVVAAIGFWFLSVAYATITIEDRVFSDGRLVSDASGDGSLLPFAGLFLALAGAIIGFRHRQYIFSIIKRNTAFTLIGAVFLVMLLTNVFYFHIASLAYIGLFIVSILTTLYANKVFGGKLFIVFAIAVSATLVLFVAVHGAPTGRWIGGIHPNHIGAFALLAAFLAAQSGHSFRWIIYLIAIFFTILVSSRYAMIAIAMIVVADYLASMSRFDLRRAIGLVILSAMFFLAILFGHEVIAHWLALHDSARGIESGFTGRAEMWNRFAPQILERPFVGFGFRQRDLYYGTHNGFLDFALENGVIVATLFFFAILSIIREGVVKLRKCDKGKRNIIITAASWFAWAFSGFFQPQLVNFGDAFGIMTMFLLTAHVKWMTSNEMSKWQVEHSPRNDAYA